MKFKFLVSICVLVNVSAYSQTPSEKSKTVDSLYRLSDSELYTRKNLEQLGKFVTSRDEAFSLYYPKGERLDSLLGKKHDVKRSSIYVVTRIAIEEEILPVLNKIGLVYKISHSLFGTEVSKVKSANPTSSEYDWKSLEKRVEAKYGSIYASQASFKTQVDLKRMEGKYNDIAKIFIKYASKLSPSYHITINEVTYSDIFKNIRDEKLLLLVAKKYKTVILGHNDNPGYIDTYANLLYKAGLVKEAIKWQKRASENLQNKDEEILANLTKMEKGLPTWPEKKTPN